MKRILMVAVASLAFAVNLVFAATPVAEPSLPKDIASWAKLPKETCKLYAGKSIVRELYVSSDKDYSKKVETLALNGQKVYHGENIYKRGSRFDDSIIRFYIRNVRENTWLAYKWSEVSKFEADLLVVLSITQEQFLSCDWKREEEK